MIAFLVQGGLFKKIPPSQIKVILAQILVPKSRFYIHTHTHKCVHIPTYTTNRTSITSQHHLCNELLPCIQNINTNQKNKKTKSHMQ